MKFWCTYVLFLEEHKVYVGSVEQALLDERLEKHACGEGARWTDKYRPLKSSKPIIFANFKTHEESLEKENTLTIKYMKYYGIENVRGHKYSRIELPEDELVQIMKTLTHDDDRCFGCGEKGHFLKRCQKNYK